MSISNVTSIRYNKTLCKLTVVYGGGTAWVYHPVSIERYLRLYASKQLSKDVHKLIRKGNIVGVKK